MVGTPSGNSKFSFLTSIFVLVSVHLCAQSDAVWKKMNITEESYAIVEKGNYSFCGIATPSTVPKRDGRRVYYLAVLSGDYSHFGNIVLADNEKAIIYKECDMKEDVLSQGYPNNSEAEDCNYQIIDLSAYNLQNRVLTSENEWKEKYSDITVLSDYIPVRKGMEYIPQSLGDFRLTIYHYDKNRKFVDITSWYTLNGPFVALGDYVRIGIRKKPQCQISPDDVRMAEIFLETDQHKLARLNISNDFSSDSLLLVLEDDFSTFDKTVWEKFDSANPSFELAYGAAPFRQNNVNVKDGALILEAKRTSNTFRGQKFSYTTGLVVSKDRFVINSGRVDVRMKVDCCPVSNAGLWLNPQFGRWPEGQEIDIVEITKMNYAAGSLHYTTHASFLNTGKAVPDDVITKPYAGIADLSDWHVWSCEWDSKTIKYYCDNILYGVITASEIEPDIPFDKSARYLVFSYGLAETQKKRKASYQMMIDWVRVYSVDNHSHLFHDDNNEIFLDYGMDNALIMHPNEWRGLYPKLKYYDGNTLSKLKLKIIQDDNHILSMGNTNMVLYSHGIGSAICEVSFRNLSKRFRVVVVDGR